LQPEGRNDFDKHGLWLIDSDKDIMNTLDWTVIIFYFVGMISLSVYLGRRQSSQEDYFVGGRKLSWWAVGLSTMATQTSAISFISIPTFVAIKAGGGLTWVQYELAVPLAIIVVMVFLIPLFREMQLVSVYEYLEFRYNRSVRQLVSGIFLISRALGTGVGVYASAIALSVCLGTPLWLTILLIGIVTIIYDTIGGITAVVYSDVIQVVILLAGVILCIAYAADHVGGFGMILNSLPEDRLKAIQFSTGLGDGATAPFWAFLVGGLFLYTSYYGTDQSQVQRELSAATTADTKRSLLLNGFARFPLTILYIWLGMALWQVCQYSPELVNQIPDDHPDYLVPQFVLLFLPQGIRAIIFASILAAAMSSLDSALNSLSAATMRDFIGQRVEKPSKLLILSKLITVCWGIIITGFAFITSHISETVIEAINKVGSIFFGPILATFLVGILSKRATSEGVFAGILAGIAFNLFLWVGIPGLHWMWWNVSGFLAAVTMTFFIRLVKTSHGDKDIDRYVLKWHKIVENERNWVPQYIVLIVYFFVIISFLLIL
jgi:SSS family solute:Na+ symporter